MSPAEMEEKIKRQQADLDREREERNYFQLERDKINTFWEITKKVSPRARTLRVPLAHACRLLCLRGVASAAAVAALEPPSLLPQQAGRCSAAAAAGWEVLSSSSSRLGGAQQQQQQAGRCSAAAAAAAGWEVLSSGSRLGGAQQQLQAGLIDGMADRRRGCE